MPVADLKSVFSMLFTAPLEAVVEAEVRYRRLTHECLHNLLQTVNVLYPAPAAGAARSPSQLAAIQSLITSQLALAPIFKINASVDAALTMRVASITTKNAEVNLQLGVGGISVGGSFGSSQQASSETVLQAAARYAVHNNTEISMTDFLANFGLTPTDPEGLKNAVEKLEKTLPASPTPSTN